MSNKLKAIMLGIVIGIIVLLFAACKDIDNSEMGGTVQTVHQSERVVVTKLCDFDDITLYIVKDIITDNEYLITQFHQGVAPEGSVSTILMNKTRR